MPNHKRIFWVDFDNTLSSYDGNYDESKYGSPIIKTVRLIEYFRAKGFSPVILTARKDLSAVRKFCKEYDIKVDDITNVKPPAVFGVDDRVVHFTQERSFESLVEEIMKIVDRREDKSKAPPEKRNYHTRNAFVGKVNK